MAIVNRISRLFSADVHAVLDRIEEPAALLKQSLREMEAAVADLRRQLQQREAERGRISQRCGQVDQQIEQINQELDLSFDAENDELIRRCLRRRLLRQRQRTQLEQQTAQLDAEIAELTPRLATRSEQLTELQQKAALFDVPPPESESEDVDNFSVTEADVDLALLRELQQRRAS